MQTTTKPTAPKLTLTDIYQRTHAGAVLLGAAIADQQLKNALLTKMRKLSRKLEKELFTGYGPLSSLSAKIALAYALGFIDNITRSRLTVARSLSGFAPSISAMAALKFFCC